jgi:protein arginine N-methyltransferase 1
VSFVLDEHRCYLSDSVRLDAFQRALAEVVRPGDIVLDLGAGTGVLGYFACRAGAARVYALESTALVGEARAIAARNGFQDRVVFYREWSTTADIPERVDVVVTDQIGPLGFEVGLVEFLADAVRRFLKPAGKLLPYRVHLEAAPLEEPSVREAIGFWRDPIRGLDCSSVFQRAQSSGYALNLSPDGLLAEPTEITSFLAAPPADEVARGEATFTAARAGVLDGAAMWFRADLSPSVTMTNSPAAAAHIERRQMVLPMTPPARVERGDRIRIAFAARLIDVVIDWQIEVGAPDGSIRAACRRSTFEGMLLSAEDLANTDPNHVPQLTRRGLARRTVLELCDGHTLRELEQAVVARHADLFDSPAAASLFILDVLRQNAR